MKHKQNLKPKVNKKKTPGEYTRYLDDLEFKLNPMAADLTFLKEINLPHSTSKCNTRKSDFEWCFKTKTLPWTIIDQRFYHNNLFI